MGKKKLFCIPYAGGSASAFISWKKKVNNDVLVYPIELSGRGIRFGETLYTSLMDIVDDVYNVLKDQIGDGEYALLGYSMGATVLYELILKLQKEEKKLPIRAFFCAQESPNLLLEKNTYKLEKEAFYEKIAKLGGIPEEVLKNEEIMELFEDILRSDYEAIETYHMNPDNEKVKVPVSVLYGGYDEDITDITGWNSVVDNTIEYEKYQDSHFFINTHENEMLDYILKRMK